MGNFGAKNYLNKQEENPDNIQTNTINNSNANEIFEKNETVSSKEENKLKDNPISETKNNFYQLKKKII